MKSNFKFYECLKSIDRIREITSSSDSSFEEHSSIPAIDKLTFSNGFYVTCSAVVCDIRNSKDLPKKYKRPKLAKLLKSFISEVTAIMNGCDRCKEILIEGDCVWGVFDTPSKVHIDEVFQVAFRVNSMMRFLNYYLEKNGFDQINVGIGISDGRALMIKAGYSGSGINDVVWLGDVVNEAHFLCSLASKGDWVKTDPIYISNKIYVNLNSHNQGLMHRVGNNDYYSGNVIDTNMEKYFEENFA